MFRLAGFFALLVIVSACTVESACGGGSSGEDVPLQGGLIEGTAAESLPPGEPGRLSIIGAGPIDRLGKVPVIARNNTSTSIRRVHISGTARGPNGDELASGGDLEMLPPVVPPGGLVFGAVMFPNAELNEDAQFEFAATFDAAEQDSSTLSLRFTELRISSDRIEGSVTNPHTENVYIPWVQAICFDTGAQPLQELSGRINGDQLAAGSGDSFTLPFEGSCPEFLISADGGTID